jgi:hypothetical protein
MSISISSFDKTLYANFSACSTLIPSSASLGLLNRMVMNSLLIVYVFLHFAVRSDDGRHSDRVVFQPLELQPSLGLDSLVRRLPRLD